MRLDRLLVIDDDAGFRNYVRRVGEAAGFETLVTADADAFRGHVRAWAPSVIMIDLNMPGADGVELLRDLAEAKTTARILIASGVDSRILETAEHLAAERGLAIAGTLSKPFAAETLTDKLEQLREVEKPLMASALANAITANYLTLEYQPKLACQSGQIVGVEALVRWRHPTRGMIAPDRFIPLAEESGTIHPLTEWVAGEAVRQAMAWRRDGLTLNMAINVSARNLENIDFPNMLSAKCENVGLSPKDMTLELTESTAMGDPAQTLDVLTRLRLKGFRLSIDDFGTGYSSLVRLRQLPVSELKIDKSFVINMDRDQDSRMIVQAVVGLSKNLGLESVAEGVETKESLSTLIQMGVPVVQGYFISMPLAPDRVVSMIKGPMTDAIVRDAKADT
jgi:EAL domain-containing protein (putative c-di-GMP-specific phosphodiesterase class I)